MIRLISLILCDVIAIPVLFLISYSVKFKAGLLYNIIFETNTGLIYNHAQIEPYFDNIGIIMIIWLVSLNIMKTYDVYTGILAFVDQIISIIKAVLLATLLLMAISMITKLMPNSLFVLGYNCLFGVIIFSSIRLVIDKVFRIKPFKPDPCCIIGKNKEAHYILEYILDQKQAHYYYMGSIYDKEPDEVLFSVKNKHKKVADYDSVETYIKNNMIKHIFVIKSEYPKHYLKPLINLCESSQITLHIYDNDIQTIRQRARFNQIADLTMLSYDVQEINYKEKIIKRLFDCTVSIVLLIGLGPLWVIIAVWIKLVSPKGPVIYKQERTGLNGKIFTMYKFRTMKPNAEKTSGPVWVNKDDKRYIFGGEFLRKFSLDEYPQLINILKNEMSIVGPRPERPFFVDQIEEEVSGFKLRHTIKGGITGWAQIHGRSYLTTRPEEKLRYDLFYIKYRSFMLDIKIMLKTCLIVTKGEQAY